VLTKVEFWCCLSLSCVWIVAGRSWYSSWVIRSKDSRFRGSNCTPTVISRTHPTCVRWNVCEYLNCSLIQFLSSISDVVYSYAVLDELEERDIGLISVYRPSSPEEFWLALIHPLSGRLLRSFKPRAWARQAQMHLITIFEFCLSLYIIYDSSICIRL
jgi:hypothetical protein